MKLKKDYFVVGLSGLAAALFLGVFFQAPSSQIDKKKDKTPPLSVAPVDNVQSTESLPKSEQANLAAGLKAEKQVATYPLSFRLLTTKVPQKDEGISAPGSVLEKTKKIKSLSRQYIELSSLPDLKTFQKGMRLGIPTSNGSSYNAVVNLVKKGRAGSIRVGGSLENSAGGFALSQGPDGFRGMVRVPEKGRTYKIEPTSDGKLIIAEYKMGDLECLGMPRLQISAGGTSNPSAAPLAATTIPAYDTKPAATAVIYIDFDGELVTDSVWNNGNEIDAAPAIYAGRPLTNTHIQGVIDSVSQDFANFNVSITTVEARYLAAPVGQRMRCIVTPTDPITLGVAGGVAFLNSWNEAGSDFDEDVPCWCFGMYEPVNMAQVISHEVGHTLGLSHDGRGTNPYYAGHGNTTSSWAPIMGVSYDRRLTQWSIGDYNGSTNTEDDIAIIASELNRVGFESDDVPNGSANWTSLASSSDGLKLAAVARDGNIYLSTNRGSTWTSAEKSRNWSAIASSSDGNSLYATERQGKIYKSTDAGVTWTAVEEIRNWSHITCSSDGSKVFVAVQGGNLFTSSDAGVTWIEITSTSWPTTLSTRDWSGLASSSDGVKLVATINGGRIYTSDDSGATWTARETTRAWSAVASSADGVNLVATVRNTNDTYVSTNSGVNWTLREVPNAIDLRSVACSSNGTIIYVGDNGGSISKSVNGGTAWVEQETDRFWSIIRSSGNGTNVIAAVTNGILLTTGDGGATWTPSIMSNTTAGSVINGNFVANGSLHSVNDQDWFRFSHSTGASNQNGSFSFTVGPVGNNSNLDLNLSVFNSSGVLVAANPLNGLITNSAPVDNRSATVSGNLPTGTYYLVVRGGSEPFNIAGGAITAGFSSYGAQGNYRVSGFFTPVPAIPQILVQPQSVAATDGTTVTLSVNAIGSGGITYQWLRNGSIMPSERGQTLRLTNVGALGNEKTGEYRVIVANATNPALFVESDPAVVTVNYRPRISGVTPRGPIKVAAGQPQNLEVVLVPGGTPPFTYTWQKVARPTNLTVRTITRSELSDTYTIAAADYYSIGTYRVTVTNVTGTVVASSNVVVSVDAPPVVLTQPSNIVIEQGRSGRLSVAAAGAARLSYRWFKVDRSGPTPVETLISTSTSPVLNIQGTPGNAGSYFVRVSNSLTTTGGGSFPDVQSSDALVEVDSRPVVTTQPVAQTRQAGDAGVTLSVAVGGSAIGRTFQWFKDGRPYLGAGSNTDTISFAPTLAWADRGSYFVEIRNRVGMVRSSVAVLRVGSKPVILVPPVSTVGATGGSVRFNLVAGGDLPLRYRWFKRGTPDVAMTPTQTSPILTLNRLAASNAGDYYCEITNGHPAGSTITLNVALSVEDPPRVTGITSNFASNNHRAAVGSSVTITPALTGTPPFAFQWLKAGRPVTSGTVNPTTGALTFASSILEDSGAYSVTVTNNTRDVNGRLLSARSSSLSLSILTPPSIIRVPRDQSVTEGQPVTLSLDALGSPTLQYQWSRVVEVSGTDQLVPLPNQRARTLTLARPTPLDSGRYRCEVRNSVGTVLSTIATLSITPIPPPAITSFAPTRGTVNELILLSGNNLSFVISAKVGGRPASVTLLNNSQLYVKVPAGLTNDTAYSIEVTSSGQGGSASTLPDYRYFAKPANDNLIDAAILTGSNFGYEGDTTNFTENDLEDGANAGFLATSWHRWTAPLSNRYTLSTRQAFDIAIARYTGIPGVGAITRIGNVVDTRLPTTNEQMVFNATAGQNFVFWVGGWNSNNQFAHQGKYALIMSASTAVPTYDFNAELNRLTDWVGQFSGSSEPKSIEAPQNEDGSIRLGGHGGSIEIPMLIWNEKFVAPSHAKKTIASVKMKLELPEGGTEDRFGWIAVDSDKAPIAALWVDGKDQSLHYTSADGSTKDLNQKMIPGSLYAIELVHDAAMNRMYIIFDGVVLHTDTTLKVTSSFSTISGSFVPSTNGSLHGSMVFSDLDVKFE